jgi:sarcosine oxidase, subunit gamma
VCAAEAGATPAGVGSASLASVDLDILEIAALQHGALALANGAQSRGRTLAPPGRWIAGNGQLILSVRPQRWLILAAPAGSSPSPWSGICAGSGIAIDVSSAFAALHLAGPAARDILARGCRLDLDPKLFPSGHAAATLAAQVSLILAALPSGFLVLTPSSTAQHLRDWLISTGRPFGLAHVPDVTIEFLFGDDLT